MQYVYRWLRVAGLVAMLAACGGMDPARAQPSGPSPAAQDGFVPIDELPADDQLPAAPFLITAYAAAWVLVFGYVWMLSRRLVRVQRELGEVRRGRDAAS